MMQKFYGFGVAKEKRLRWRYKSVLTEQFRGEFENDQRAWSELNKINISEFFERTAPIYFIENCTINQMDCRFFWQKRQTFLGQCLEFNPKYILEKWKVAAIVVRKVEREILIPDQPYYL
mgnify:CR=1 FL=1